MYRLGLEQSKCENAFQAFLRQQYADIKVAFQFEYAELQSILLLNDAVADEALTYCCEPLENAPNPRELPSVSGPVDSKSTKLMLSPTAQYYIDNTSQQDRNVESKDSIDVDNRWISGALPSGNADAAEKEHGDVTRAGEAGKSVNLIPSIVPPSHPNLIDVYRQNVDQEWEILMQGRSSHVAGNLSFEEEQAALTHWITGTMQNHMNQRTWLHRIALMLGCSCLASSMPSNGLAKITQQKLFNVVCTVAILMNTVFLGYECDVKMQAVMQNPPDRKSVV